MNAIPSSGSSPEYVYCRHDTGRGNQAEVVGHVGKEDGHGEEVVGGRKVSGVVGLGQKVCEAEAVQYTRASYSGARKSLIGQRHVIWCR